MNKTFEETLPEGYAPVKTVDVKDKKTVTRLTVLSLLLTAAGIALSVAVFRPAAADVFSGRYGLAVITLLVYVVLHELTHGAAYKILTGRKLTFGFSLTAAYCGVPDIYVYRKTALISLFAPFTVFTIVFLLGACLLPNAMDRFYAAAILSFHIGGCAGDLYDAWLLLSKLREPSLLMQDNGPKQTFYLKAGRGE